MNFDQQREIFDATAVSVIATALYNSHIRVVDLEAIARVTTSISDNPSLIQSPALFLNHIREMQVERRAKLGSNEDQQTFSLIIDYLIKRIRDAITPSLSNSPFSEFFDQAEDRLNEHDDSDDPFSEYLYVEYVEKEGEELPDKKDDIPLAFLKEEIIERIKNKIASNFKDVNGKPTFVFKGSGKALSDLLKVIDGYETIADKENGEAITWIEEVIDVLKKFTALPRHGYSQRDMEDAETTLREYTLALYARQQEAEGRMHNRKAKPLPSGEALSTVITKRLAASTITRYIQNILSNDLEGIFAINYLVSSSILEINAIVRGVLQLDTEKLRGSVASDEIKYFSDVIKEIVFRLNEKIEQISINDGDARKYRTLMHRILDQINTTVVEFPGKYQTLNLFPTDLLELASKITAASARWVDFVAEA